MTEFNQLQTIKRYFFAMRNGIIADTLRKAGSPYKIIFGLNLPQLTEYAEQLGFDAELSRTLWNNRSTRESMLLAPMIFPVAEMDFDEAKRWICESPYPETTDILCHKLIRKLPFAWDLAEQLIKSPNDLQRYAAIRIFWNLVSTHASTIKPLICNEAESGNAMTSNLAQRLMEEIDYLTNED